MLNRTQRRPSTLIQASCRFISSVSWQTLASTKADPLAVIEASLTSVKYAFYQILGYSTLHFLGYHCRNTTIMTSASCGFIGGAIFTIPYLILLLPMDWQVREDFGSIGQQVIVLRKEMMFSAFAGGIGVLILEGLGWSGQRVLIGIGQGLLGPFVSYALLHVALKVVLGSVWIFMSRDS